ncbi:YheC/YheD family protein [Paenibacillus profundus]|uniref:YheC/YheD family protein n=1 Tax=Paenibacillus profundus TaxID=1173085 RepID=A0ABS8YH33_9BACL|nr:YheC/YheD family protein [Paenibacillus profundus]MCE5171275.1 YheC/YheD family protein [Paenibacillus profundus]
MAQPVLGILTLYLNDHKQLEERPIYQKMIAAGKKIGLDVYVFTPQDVDDQQQRIYAMCYHPETGRWSRKWTRFPNMIFDRCRIQKSYRFEQLKRFRSKYNHLLFLNRPLRNKWTIYQVLSTVSYVKQHLPITRLYSSVQDVQLLLKQFPLVYLKPINGTGGRGILRIERIRSNTQTVYVQGRDHQRRIIRPQKMTLSQLSAKLSSWNAKERYLVQQGISLNLPSGRVHDYRMLVQKNGSGKWAVTGCAGRVGAIKSITSNLHGGGEAVRMDELLRQWIGDEERMKAVKKEAEEASLEIAQFLEQKYGALCELALDLAIDRSGHVWLLEVNPKPAREVFIRTGDRETYRLAITRPLEYASWLYKQKNNRTILANLHSDDTRVEEEAADTETNEDNVESSSSSL